jgi:hypothetical protein
MSAEEMLKEVCLSLAKRYFPRGGLYRLVCQLNLLKPFNALVAFLAHEDKPQRPAILPWNGFAVKRVCYNQLI